MFNTDTFIFYFSEKGFVKPIIYKKFVESIIYLFICIINFPCKLCHKLCY